MEQIATFTAGPQARLSDNDNNEDEVINLVTGKQYSVSYFEHMSKCHSDKQASLVELTIKLVEPYNAGKTQTSCTYSQNITFATRPLTLQQDQEFVDLWINAIRGEVDPRVVLHGELAVVDWTWFVISDPAGGGNLERTTEFLADGNIVSLTLRYCHEPESDSDSQ